MLSTISLIRTLFRDIEGGSIELRVRLWLLEHRIVIVKGMPVDVFTLERKIILDMMPTALSQEIQADSLKAYISRFRQFLVQPKVTELPFLCYLQPFDFAPL